MGNLQKYSAEEMRSDNWNRLLRSRNIQESFQLIHCCIQSVWKIWTEYRVPGRIAEYLTLKTENQVSEKFDAWNAMSEEKYEQALEQRLGYLLGKQGELDEMLLIKRITDLVHTSATGANWIVGNKLLSEAQKRSEQSDVLIDQQNAVITRCVVNVNISVTTGIHHGVIQAALLLEAIDNFQTTYSAKLEVDHLFRSGPVR